MSANKYFTKLDTEFITVTAMFMIIFMNYWILLGISTMVLL